MTPAFWDGFEKMANKALSAFRSGMKAGRKAKALPKLKPAPVAHTIDYSGGKPRLLDAAGNEIAPKVKTTPPPQPKDIHQQAAEELARRSESVAKGGIPHSQWQEALENK